jgi:hypothetical protein
MTLLRSEFFILGFLLIGLSSYFALKKDTLKKISLYSAFSLLLCAGIIAPWTYRNYKLFHTFIPVLSHPWYEMWRGNNIYSSGSNYNEKGEGIWISPDKYPQIIKQMDAIPYDQFFEAKVDGVFRNEVIHFIEEHPLRFLFLGVKKVASLFTVDFYHPSSNNPLYFGPMLFVSALTVGGLYQLIRNPFPQLHSAALIFTVFFLFYIALTFVTVVLPRYQIYIFTASLSLTGIQKASRNQ